MLTVYSHASRLDLYRFPKVPSSHRQIDQIMLHVLRWLKMVNFFSLNMFFLIFPQNYHNSPGVHKMARTWDSCTSPFPPLDDSTDISQSDAVTTQVLRQVDTRPRSSPLIISSDFSLKDFTGDFLWAFTVPVIHTHASHIISCLPVLPVLYADTDWALQGTRGFKVWITTLIRITAAVLHYFSHMVSPCFSV